MPIARRTAVCLGLAAAAASPGVAMGYDLFVSSAAVDQPRINVAFAPASDPNNPYTGSGIFGGETIQVQAYFDTGASGIVISEGVAAELGIGLQTVNGQEVIFSDVSPGGLVDFYVSDPLVVRLSDYLGIWDGEEPYASEKADPANFTTLYQPTALNAANPGRLQVGPAGGGGGFFGDLNVVGVPTMTGKTLVFNPQPTNNILTLLDDDDTNDNYDAFMYSYVYESGGRNTRGPATLENPGVPAHDVSIQLSYSDFSRFTQVSHPAAEAPTLKENPFLGPDPLLHLNGGDPGNQPPPVRISMGQNHSEGSWLLDTGAAASFVSEATAADIGVSYDPANPLGSPNPKLLGVSADRQFQLQISGISGEVMNVAGFYADQLTLPTEKGNPGNLDDPDNLHYQGAPVLVFDITLEDPVTGDLVTLDGILGMNYFVASADIEQIPGEILPIFTDYSDTPFDWIIFDQPSGKLMLNFADGAGGRGFRNVVPEPGAALALGSLALLALRRRR